MFIAYVSVLIVMVLGGKTMILDFQFFFLFFCFCVIQIGDFRFSALFDGSKFGIWDVGLQLKRILQ